MNYQQTYAETDILSSDEVDEVQALRVALIELILPFAEESKQIKNHQGNLPW